MHSPEINYYRSLGRCHVVEVACEFVGRWVLRQQDVGEESITDWLLFSLGENIDSFKYYKFTKHQEGQKTGADWEWWFNFGGICLGMRIQAKKVTKNNYASITYPNGTAQQIRKLRHHAQDQQLLAGYCFYTNAGLWTRNRGDRSCGVWLSSADEVYNSIVADGLRQINPMHLENLCIPFPSIFCECDSEIIGESIAHAFHAYGLIVGREISRQDIGASLPPGLFWDAPEYVKGIGNYPTGRVPDWWVGEFGLMRRGLAGIIIIELD
jgi:hypothetical protein